MYATNVGAAKDEKDKTTYTTVEVAPEFTKAGVTPRKGYKTVSVTGSKPIPGVKGFVEVNEEIKDAKGNGTGKYRKSKKEKIYSLAQLDAYTVETLPNGERSVTAVITYPDIKTSTLSPEEENVFLKFRNGGKLTETEEMTVSRVTKGAEYKKEVVRLSEKDAFKFSKQMGFDNVNQMKDAAGSDIEEVETKGKWSNK